MIKAKNIMNAEVETIRGSATITEAIKLMTAKELEALIVEPRGEGDPYGILTQTDIVYKVIAYGADPEEMRVYQIMTKPCIAIDPELGVEYIARLFAQTGICRAPVIQGKLLGIISVKDILHKNNFLDEPKQLFIEDRIEEAREKARAICQQKGDKSPDCVAAWDIVEELEALAGDRTNGKHQKSYL
jgi:CBS domain-containing protein